MSEEAKEAPAPEAMREEMILETISRSSGKVNRHMAEQVVDGILLRQMRFYAQFADPEVTADPAEQFGAVQEATGMIAALIAQGAAVSDYMADKQKWQNTAARARQAGQRLLELFA